MLGMLSMRAEHDPGKGSLQALASAAAPQLLPTGAPPTAAATVLQVCAGRGWSAVLICARSAAHARTYVCVKVHAHVRVEAHAHVHVEVHAHVRVEVHAHVHVEVHARVYECMDTCL